MSELREDLDKAFEGIDDDQEEQGEVEAQQAEETADGDIASEEKAVEEEGAEQSNVEAGSNIEQQAEVKEQAQEKPQQVDEDKAPTSWSPKLRESWKGVPKDVKAQILKREQDITRSLEDGKEYRKQGEAFNNMIQPYQAIMAAEGVSDPLTGMKGLLDTVAMLRSGNPQQKAQRLAQMIGHYDIDVTALDNALSGNASVDPQQTRMEQMLEQKMAPINQLLNQAQTAQQTQQQQVQQDADKSITEFAAQNEFFNDVRQDMADLMDLATKQGREMSLQQAYDTACGYNQGVQEALTVRKKQESLLGNQQTIAQKQTAASSIKGNQVGGGQQQAPSLHGQLSDAWDKQVHG